MRHEELIVGNIVEIKEKFNFVKESASSRVIGESYWMDNLTLTQQLKEIYKKDIPFGMITFLTAQENKDNQDNIDLITEKRFVLIEEEMRNSIDQTLKDSIEFRKKLENWQPSVGKPIGTALKTEMEKCGENTQNFDNYFFTDDEISKLKERWDGLLKAGKPVKDERNATICMEHVHDFYTKLFEESDNLFTDKTIIPVVRLLLCDYFMKFDPNHIYKETSKITMKFDREMFEELDDMGLDMQSEMINIVMYEFIEQIKNRVNTDKVITFYMEIGGTEFTLYVD